jgi:polyhydroxybutyrate depolymerase
MPLANRSLIVRTCILAGLLALAACGGGSVDVPAPPAPTPAPPVATLQIEPAAGTTIGTAQAVNIFAAYKARSTDAFPAYVTGAQVLWSSSRPDVATVTGDGVVTGIAAGDTVITLRYLGLSSQIPVRVAGVLITRSLFVPGQGVRGYSVMVPSGVAAGTTLPVLLSLHGGGGSALIQASTSLLSELAETRKLLVVYLNGTGAIQTYNAGACCGSAQTGAVDDVAYVRAVLDDITAHHTIDTARVYASGFSNGGMMAHRLACEMADRISGIAAVSGASAQFDRSHNVYYSCNPSRPIPILHVHATNDRNYPFAGGVGAGISSTDFYPVDSTIADWIVRNNVAPQYTAVSVTRTTTCYRYATVANTALPSAPVTLCKVDPPDVYDAANDIVFGGGHSWPGGSRSPSPSADAPVTDFSVNQYLWSYFGN